MSSSNTKEFEKKRAAKKEARKAAKILEAQPLYVGGLLADRSEEARKEKRALYTRSENRLHLQQDVCILQPFPLVFQPPVTITLTNPDGLTLYPHDIRIWPASPPKPAKMTSNEKRVLLYERLLTLEQEIIEIVTEAHQCSRMTELGDSKSSVKKAINKMAREIQAGKAVLSSPGAFPREERRKAERWFVAAYKSYDDLIGVVYHLLRCERKDLDLGLLPAMLEQVARGFPSFGTC